MAVVAAVVAVVAAVAVAVVSRIEVLCLLNVEDVKTRVSLKKPAFVFWARLFIGKKWVTLSHIAIGGFCDT